MRSFFFGTFLGAAYCLFTYAVPQLVMLFPNNFKDGQLISVHSLGKFTITGYEVVGYKLSSNGEIAYENNFFSKNIEVETEKQEDGTYTIIGVNYGNDSYEKTFSAHPEILAKANEILRIGREGLEKEKKRLENPGSVWH